jgi:hypothetical protein
MSAENVEASELSIVKKWLAKHPKRAVGVSLTTKDAEGEKVELGSWEVAEAPPGLAAELVAACDQFAQVSDRDCTGSVVWLDVKGKVLQTRLLRRKHRPTEADPLPPMSGSPQDQAAMAQNHLQKMTQLYYNGIGGMMLQMKTLAETCVSMARDVMQQSARDRELIEELRSEIQEIVVTQAEVAAETAEDAAKKAEEEKEPSAVEQAVGMVIPMLMQGAANATKASSGGQTPPNGAASA